MNIRDRILATVDQSAETEVPWTIYRDLLPRGQAERELRDAGLGLQVQVPVFSETHPHVQIERQEKLIEGRLVVRTIYHTTAGDAQFVQQRDSHIAYGSAWTIEPLLKSMDDYAAVRFLIEDTTYSPNYDVIRQAQEELGGDGIVLGAVGLSPFQQLVNPDWLGMEGVSYWLADHPAEFDSLIQALVLKMDRVYDLAAEAPVRIVHSDENVTALMVGPRLYERYHLPFYRRVVPRLHAAGKLYATHFDGSIRPLAHLIEDSPIDIVEAFTPPPMGDFRVTEAKALWPGKVIWINYPGNVFLWDEDIVVQYTADLLREAAPGGRFVLGITEDIPDGIRESGLRSIAEGIRVYYERDS